MRAPSRLAAAMRPELLQEKEAERLDGGAGPAPTPGCKKAPYIAVRGLNPSPKERRRRQPGVGGQSCRSTSSEVMTPWTTRAPAAPRTINRVSMDSLRELGWARFSGKP